MGLTAVHPKVWLVLVAVFLVAFAVVRARLWWAGRRARLAERIAASIRARSARSRP